MMDLSFNRTGYRSHRRKAAVVVLSAGVVILSAFIIGWVGGYRINLTPSEPLGLWRIVPLDRPAVIGDVVFICPPGTAAMREAKDRGYLRPGLCPTGYAPFIKTIVGVAGQDVEVGVDVQIAGHAVPRSKVSSVDGEGRPLARVNGGAIPIGYVFVHSEFTGSFDSRYFGPIPASGIPGLAKEVWTYAP